MDEQSRLEREALRRRIGRPPRPDVAAVAAPGFATLGSRPMFAAPPDPVPAAPADLVEALVPVVVAVGREVADRVPQDPAALLGRIGAPPLPFDVGLPVLVPGMVTAALGERLLGALELTLPGLAVSPPPLLADRLRTEVRDGSYATISAHGEGATVAALRLVDQFAPGLRDLTAGLVAGLADGPALPAAPTGSRTEEDLAAARGRGLLAVAVVTALAVLRATAHPMVGAGAPAVVGLALDAVERVLPDRPLLPGYRAALLELRRARYLLPRSSGGSVPVSGRRFALVEGAYPAGAPEPANGLVAAVPGGLVLRTGTADGRVRVALRVLDGPADAPDPDGWSEVVELSYEALEGSASLIGPTGPGEANLLEQTPPWPGPVRARVCARGRDGLGSSEQFEIALWQAPAAPETVLADGGPLGRRLRGEPEQPVAGAPDSGYGWFGRSFLAASYAVTVVEGATADEVLTAFGADPDAPASFRELLEQFGIDPWVAVLPVDGGVLAVEPNGWQGEQAPVLRRLSARGRAACSYLGGHGVSRWSFARDGEVVASFEPLWPHETGDPDLAAALDGIDLADHRDSLGKGFVAIGRFAGHLLTEQDLARIEAAGVAYRILPQLPELYREERLPDGSRRWAGDGILGPDTDRLARLPDDALRELAWWAAGAAVERAGRGGEPAISATLAARALTADAERAARASGLEGGKDHQMWLALHQATNPDALAAAIHTVDRARWVFGPDAADFLDRVRARALS